LETCATQGKCITFGKERHTWKKESNLKRFATLEEMCRIRENQHTFKNASFSEKCASFGKTGHTWKNGLHASKMRHTWKCVTLLGKYPTLGKMHPSPTSAPHLVKCGTLEICATFRKMGDTWKNGLHASKMRHTWKCVAHLGKCITLRKMHPSRTNAPQLVTCGTLEKMRHI